MKMHFYRRGKMLYITVPAVKDDDGNVVEKEAHSRKQCDSINAAKRESRAMQNKGTRYINP